MAMVVVMREALFSNFRVVQVDISASHAMIALLADVGKAPWV